MLEEARRKWDHVHALVEELEMRRSTQSVSVRAKSAVMEGHVERLQRSVRRASSDLSTLLAERGFALLAEDVQQMTVLARGAGVLHRAKVIRMKEVIAVIYDALDFAQRKVIEDDKDEDLIRSLL